MENKALPYFLFICLFKRSLVSRFNIKNIIENIKILINIDKKFLGVGIILFDIKNDILIWSNGIKIHSKYLNFIFIVSSNSSMLKTPFKYSLT